MSKTKTPPEKPKFGSDQIEKHLEFEALVFERLAEGATPDDCLQPHEQQAAMMAFGWDQTQLWRECVRIAKVFRAKMVVGTAAEREQLRKNAEKATAAHQKLLDELSDRRRELDRLERESFQNQRHLNRRCDEVETAVSTLRALLPPHAQQARDLQKSQFRRGAWSDLKAVTGEIREIELLLEGPVCQPGYKNPLQAEAFWHDRLKQRNPRFIQAKEGRGYQVTELWNKEVGKLQERLAVLKKQLPKLEKQVAEDEASLADFENFYLSDD